MRRILFPLFFAATTMAACGDDSTPSTQVDATVADSVNTDTLPDTGGNNDATTPNETAQETTPNETVQETTPNETVQETVQETRQDAETTGPTFDEGETCPGIFDCANACPTTPQAEAQACVQGCLTGKEESGIVQALVGCLDGAGCFDEGLTEEQAIACQFENCTPEIIECDAGIDRGPGTCVDLTQCLSADDDLEGNRECYSAATDDAVTAFFQLQFCFQTECGDVPAAQQQACIEASLGDPEAGTPGACTTQANACAPAEGRSAGAGRGGQFNPGQFDMKAALKALQSRK